MSGATADGSTAVAAVPHAPVRLTAIQLGSTDGPVADLLAWVLSVDAAVAELFVAARTPTLTKFMTSVTGLGSASAAAVFLGIFYLAGWRRELAVGAVALGLTGVVVPALMYLTQRPFPANPVCQTGSDGLTPHSFPSGHAAAVTVLALISRGSDHLPFRIATALAATVAVSRMYLGTHYLSDTLFGVAIGIAAFAVGRAVGPRLRARLPDAE
jgi:undecaprenyl-diphosphatase